MLTECLRAIRTDARSTNYSGAFISYNGGDEGMGADDGVSLTKKGPATGTVPMVGQRRLLLTFTAGWQFRVGFAVAILLLVRRIRTDEPVFFVSTGGRSVCVQVSVVRENQDRRVAGVDTNIDARVRIARRPSCVTNDSLGAVVSGGGAAARDATRRDRTARFATTCHHEDTGRNTQGCGDHQSIGGLKSSRCTHLRSSFGLDWLECARRCNAAAKS